MAVCTHELDRAAPGRSSGHYDTHREWWVSAEAMVGFLHAYGLTGEDGFREKSIGAWQFTKDHLLDTQRGEWRWGVLDDYRPMVGEDKIGFWKCPYHNARACVEVLERLRQIDLSGNRQPVVRSRAGGTGPICPMEEDEP